MNSNGRYFSLACAALVATLVASDARAQSPEDEPEERVEDSDAAAQDDEQIYREAFVEGRDLFEQERWAEARERFQRAYDARAEPILLFNIASTYRRDGMLREALAHYEQFLDEAAPDDDLRSLAEELVAAIGMKLAAEQAQAREAEREAAEPEVEVAPQPEPDRGRPVLRYSGLATAALGAGALGWGAFEGYRAHSTASDLSGLETGTPWTHDLQRDYDRGEQAQRRALMLSAAGGVAVAGGLTLYVLGRGKSRASAEQPAVSLAPFTSPTSFGLLVHGHLD